MKLAYIFPGQGSQQVGMLADAQAAVSDLFSQASDVLGYDLWQLIQQGPEEQLNQTEFTQPALLTASVALYQQAISKGAAPPALVAGHSLGEYSALVAASVLPFTDAVRLVQQRGQFMQSAVPAGAGGMAAIMGLEDAQVAKICQQVTSSKDSSTGGTEELVQAVNFNAPGQVVIAGTSKALAAAIDACQSAGAKRAIPLAVSAPFHSELMKPAADRMREVLEQVTFNAPSFPVMQNVDAKVHESPDAIRENLVAQMHSPVRWTDTVRNLASAGVGGLVEAGPGKVLTGLAKRIDKSLALHNVDSIQAAENLTEALPNG